MDEFQKAKCARDKLWCRIRVWDPEGRPQVTVRLRGSLLTMVLRREVRVQDPEQALINHKLRNALETGEFGRVYHGRGSDRERFEIWLEGPPES